MTEADVNVLTERLDNLIKQFDQSETLSAEWRNRFCQKLDKMFDRFDELPCGARIKETEAMGREIGWLQKIVWTVCILGIPSIISLAGIASVDHNTLSQNTKRWELHDEKYEVQHEHGGVRMQGMSLVGSNPRS